MVNFSLVPADRYVVPAPDRSWRIQEKVIFQDLTLNPALHLLNFDCRESCASDLRVFVAEGVGTGPKSATTIAFTRATGAGEHPLSPRLLGQQWLTRWRRSQAKFPTTLANEERDHFEKLIETHQQFFSES